MNAVSTVTFFVEELFRTNPLVNTITYSKSNEIDLNKENIYPLVNIDELNMVIDDQVIYQTYEIYILEARDITPVLNNDKLFVDNLIDNLNETTYIATKFINAVRRIGNDDCIDVDTISDIQFVKNDYGNGLDGCYFTIRLSIPNRVSAC